MTKTTLDQLPSIHDTIRSHIEKNGSHYGYSLFDFDSVFASFRDDEAMKENFLQELYDALPTDETKTEDKTNG